MTESSDKERMEGDLDATEENVGASKYTAENEPNEEVPIRMISRARDHADLLAPPALTVQTHIHREDQLPGAFRVFPGDADGAESEEEDELETHQNSTGHDPRSQQTGIGEIYLVEADLVDERTDSQAEIFPAILVQDRPSRRYYLWLLLGLALLLIIGLSLGVYLATNDRAAATTNPVPSVARSPNPSSSPSSNPTAALSSLPSYRPSISPSEQPTSAPSKAVTRPFRGNLPNFTLDALRNDSSPQARAFEWVTIDDRSHAMSRMTQRFALATLFYATTNRLKWKNKVGWLNSSMHECDWYGCNCKGNGTIGTLDLSWNKLKGSIPKEISLLSGLESLLLSGNSKLQGKLFTEVGALLRLTSLSLYGTDISGSLPTEIGLLTGLAELELGAPRLTGTIPTEAGSLRQLRRLDLYGCRLVGAIPTELGRLSLLSDLDIGMNELSSTVPAELGNLSSLKKINLPGNRIAGTLPSELSSLPALELLVFFNNSLNGSIPTEFGRFQRLTLFSLEWNQLSGSIPTELGLLSDLSSIWLFNNSLSGTIPTELGFLTNLNDKGLSLDNNLLKGTLPTELGRLSRVRYMDFYLNKLHGHVPSELCGLVSKGLDLQIDCDRVNCSCGTPCNCKKFEERRHT
jgi:hypothetical protein